MMVAAWIPVQLGSGDERSLTGCGSLIRSTVGLLAVTISIAHRMEVRVGNAC